MKIVHRALAPLASLEVQKRYIIEGTKEEYLLPDDLLNRAINVLFGQRAIRFNETAALKELKEAIRSCDIPKGMSNSELVLGYGPWIRVRKAAKRYLSDTDFDFEAWEKAELK